MAFVVVSWQRALCERTTGSHCPQDSAGVEFCAALVDYMYAIYRPRQRAMLAFRRMAQRRNMTTVQRKPRASSGFTLYENIVSQCSLELHFFKLHKALYWLSPVPAN